MNKRVPRVPSKSHDGCNVIGSGHVPKVAARRPVEVPSRVSPDVYMKGVASEICFIVMEVFFQQLILVFNLTFDFCIVKLAGP